MTDRAFPAVVVMLPYTSDRLLLQLRDSKPGIVHPGKWGFFSGSIEAGETPAAAAKRELFEEIGFRPQGFRRLPMEHGPVGVDLIFHLFSCPLPVAVETLVLKEGFDLGLFTFDEIRAKKLLSVRAGRDFPVIDDPFIWDVVNRVQDIAGRKRV